MSLTTPSPGAADRVRHKLRAASFQKHGKDLHSLLAQYDTSRDGTIAVSEIVEGVQQLLPGAVEEKELQTLVDTATSSRVDYRAFFEFTPVRHYTSAVSPVSQPQRSAAAASGAPQPSPPRDASGQPAHTATSVASCRPNGHGDHHN